MKLAEVAACRCDVGEFLCGLPLAKLAAELRRDVDAHGFAGPQLAGADSLLEARLSVTKKSACGHPSDGVLSGA